MQLLLKHKLLIAGVAALAAASAGGAYAATQSGTSSQQAFINDVAKRLNVSPGQLSSAVKLALIDRINAAVKAGKLTQAEAKQLEQRINRGGLLPFFLGAPEFGRGHGFFIRPRGGALPAAAGYLGLSNAQLMADLASGKSLAQIAKAHGKSVPGLEQALITAETTRLGQLQSRGVITKAEEQRILNRLATRISRLVIRSGFGPGHIPGAPRIVPPDGPVPQGVPMMPPASVPPVPSPGAGGPPPPAP